MVSSRVVPYLHCFSQSTYLDDINDILMGLGYRRNIHWHTQFPCLQRLCADDLCLTSNPPDNLQTMLHRLKAYTHKTIPCGEHKMIRCVLLQLKN
eukprot:scaffold56292_cov18-Tisochrysis_lutea.AAC.1